MTTTVRAPIQTGWDVFDSTGDRVGTIADVGRNYVRVEKGLIFIKDIYIPGSEIAQIDEANQAIWLDTSKDAIESMGWDGPPANDWTWQQWSAAGGRSGQPFTTTDRKRMAVHEEELEARKVPRKAGDVEIRKDVVQEHRTIDVPVTREEVKVQRVPADRDAAPGEATFDDGRTIRVPVMDEQVQVTKRPRVTEEVEVQKVAHQETERVGDTVRKERVGVSGDGVRRD